MIPESGDSYKFKNRLLSDLFIKIFWLSFFFSLVFLIDVKLARYKLVGMQLSLLGLLLVWFLKDYRNIFSLFREALFLPVIIFVLFFSAAYFISPAGAAAYPQWQRVLFSAVAYITAYKLFYGRGSGKLVNVLIAAGGLISIYGLLQHTGGLWFVRVPELNRVFGTFGNPNFFASFLIGLIPLAAASFFREKRIWKFASVFFMLAALYYTKTRGAWLGLTAAGIIWYIIRGRKKVPAFITVLVVLAAALFIFMNRTALSRGTERLLIWRDSLKMAAANPVTGVGLGNYHNEFPSYASARLLEILPQGKFIVNYAHNEFIDILSETGIAGLGIYLWLLAVFFTVNLKSGYRNYIQSGAFFGATAVIIHSAVSVNMRFAVTSIWAFFLMGLSAGDITGNSGTAGRLKKWPAAFKITALLIVIPVFFIWTLKVIDPLAARKKLISETDFFDSRREYSKEELNALLEREPGNALLYYKLGWIEAKEKNFPPAIKNFKKAVELDSSLTGAYNNLGNIYFSTGNRAEAEKYYIEALKRDSSMADAHFNLGYIYYYQGRLKEATRQFNRVLELEPENYKAKMMLEKMVQ